ncbi:hypothetical protein LCGC14_0478480 [marine sediment metagenome]|uniref:M23ase beta-sheet core domain-containing protein n=1 Tax=marine sediment metagenome TaxID=412755 RepID=A0A0F9SFA2_9ZZZZ
MYLRPIDKYPFVWTWPLAAWSFAEIPGISSLGKDTPSSHRGSFGTVRKHDIHTGVDLYCEEGTKVFAVEEGTVVVVENFTGPNADDPSPWWNDTEALLVEGKTGVVLYGEIEVGLHRGFMGYICKGSRVKEGQLLGVTKPVLKKDKGEPMCMLHFELYKRGTTESVWWKFGDPKPKNLFNPTARLEEAFRSLKYV